MYKTVKFLLTVLTLALVIALIKYLRVKGLWWWFEVHTGTVNEPGPYYGFWSGFGSDIGEAAMVTGVIGLYKKHNCHVKGCPWLGHFKFTDKSTDTDYFLCKKHHPHVPRHITLEHILGIHKK